MAVFIGGLITSRKSLKTPNEASINYWYKQALDYLKKYPLKSQAQLNKIAEDFALYSCREFYGYRGIVPKAKIQATKDLLLNKFVKSSIIKKQLGI